MDRMVSGVFKREAVGVAVWMWLRTGLGEQAC